MQSHLPFPISMKLTPCSLAYSAFYRPISSIFNRCLAFDPHINFNMMFSSQWIQDCQHGFPFLKPWNNLFPETQPSQGYCMQFPFSDWPGPDLRQMMSYGTRWHHGPALIWANCEHSRCLLFHCLVTVRCQFTRDWLQKAHFQSKWKFFWID